jgi:hypothetical protein
LPGVVPQPTEGPSGTSPPELSGSGPVSEPVVVPSSLDIGALVLGSAPVLGLGPSSSAEPLPLLLPVPSSVASSVAELGASAGAAHAALARSKDERSTGRDIARTIAAGRRPGKPLGHGSTRARDASLAFTQVPRRVRLLG